MLADCNLGTGARVGRSAHMLRTYKVQKHSKSEYDTLKYSHIDRVLAVANIGCEELPPRQTLEQCIYQPKETVAIDTLRSLGNKNESVFNAELTEGYDYIYKDISTSLVAPWFPTETSDPSKSVLAYFFKKSADTEVESATFNEEAPQPCLAEAIN